MLYETYETVVRQLPTFWQNPYLRRQFIQGAGIMAGIGAGIAGYAFLHEPLNVRLERLTIRLPNAAAHLPKQGLQILHLSDTHFSGKDWREQRKIESIRRVVRDLEYDLLIHTGDFLHYDSGLPNVLALLDSLPQPRLGAFAVFGNHDYTTYSHSQMFARSWTNFCAYERNNGPWSNNGRISTNGNGQYNGQYSAKASTSSTVQPNRKHPSGKHPGGKETNGKRNGTTPFQQAARLLRFGHYFLSAPLDLKRIGRNNYSGLEAALAERNIQTLHNRYTRLSHADAGVDLYIAGVDDVVEGSPNIREALSDIPYDAPTLLLSHNPDILHAPGIEQVDLVLSGHTHGGQIVLPWFGAAHTQSEALERHEVAGYLCRGKTQVYISRGVGEGIPLRFGAAPHISLLTVVTG
jgi:predicted MPP superfamily phosphohydrolase